MAEENNNDKPIRIEDLFPRHSPEWYAEAEANIQQYLTVLIRIAERLACEGKKPQDLDRYL